MVDSKVRHSRALPLGVQPVRIHLQHGGSAAGLCQDFLVGGIHLAGQAGINRRPGDRFADDAVLLKVVLGGHEQAPARPELMPSLGLSPGPSSSRRYCGRR